MGFENRPKDFFAKQIRSSHLIASGGIIDPASSDWDEQLPNLRLMIYPRDALEIETPIAGSNYIEGAFEGIVPPQLLDDTTGSGLKVGDDVWLFISGAQHTQHTFNEENELYPEDEKRAKTGVVLFGGDVVISGTLFAERQVIEVDLSQEGQLFISGNLVAQDYTADINFVQFMAPEDNYPRDWLTGEDAAITFEQDAVTAYVDVTVGESIIRFMATTAGAAGNAVLVKFEKTGTGTTGVYDGASATMTITYEEGVTTIANIVALGSTVSLYYNGGDVGDDTVITNAALEYSSGGDGIHEMVGGVNADTLATAAIPDAVGTLHDLSDAPDGWSASSIITVSDLNAALLTHGGIPYDDRATAIVNGACYDAYNPHATGPSGTGHTLFNIDSINNYLSINNPIPSASLDVRRQAAGDTNIKDQIILLAQEGDSIDGVSNPLASMKDGNTGMSGQHDDTAFYVWGVPGGKAAYNAGAPDPDYTVGVFGGDLVVSGGLYNESGFLDISSTHDNIGTPASNPSMADDLSDGTVIGTIQFSGTETAGDFAKGAGARIEAEAATDWTAADRKTRLNFFTNSGVDDDSWDADGPMGASAESSNAGLAMTIDHNQNVGIGIEEPAVSMHIVDTTSPTIRVEDSTSNVKTDVYSTDDTGGIGTTSTHPFSIVTDGTSGIYIDTNQKVGLSEIAPDSRLHIFAEQPTDSQEVDTDGNGISEGPYGTTNFWHAFDPEEPLAWADSINAAAAIDPLKIIGLKADITDYDLADTQPKVLTITNEGHVRFKEGGLGGAKLKEDRDGREDAGDPNKNESFDGITGDDHDGGGATVNGDPYDHGLFTYWTGDTLVGHALDDVNHALHTISNNTAWEWVDTDGIAGGDKVILREETNAVGIGTDDPMQKIHVYGGETSNAAIRIESNETDGSGAVVNLEPHAKIELALDGTVHSTLSQNTKPTFTTANGTDTILQNHTAAGGIYLSTFHTEGANSYALAPFIIDSNNNADRESIQVLVLSGTHGGDPLLDPRSFDDTNFYVSGSIGSCVNPVGDGTVQATGNSTRGTAVFGGDLYVSGAIFSSGGVVGGGSGSPAQNITIPNTWKAAFNGVCIDVFDDVGSYKNYAAAVLPIYAGLIGVSGYPAPGAAATNLKVVARCGIPGLIGNDIEVKLIPGVGTGITIDFNTNPMRLDIAWVGTVTVADVANAVKAFNWADPSNQPSNHPHYASGFRVDLYPVENGNDVWFADVTNQGSQGPWIFPLLNGENSTRFVSWGADGTSGGGVEEGGATQLIAYNSDGSGTWTQDPASGAWTYNTPPANAMISYGGSENTDGNTFTYQQWIQGITIPYDCTLVGFSVRYIARDPIDVGDDNATVATGVNENGDPIYDDGNGNTTVLEVFPDAEVRWTIGKLNRASSQSVTESVSSTELLNPYGSWVTPEDEAWAGVFIPELSSEITWDKSDELGSGGGGYPIKYVTGLTIPIEAGDSLAVQALEVGEMLGGYGAEASVTIWFEGSDGGTSITIPGGGGGSAGPRDLIEIDETDATTQNSNTSFEYAMSALSGNESILSVSIASGNTIRVILPAPSPADSGKTLIIKDRVGAVGAGNTKISVTPPTGVTMDQYGPSIPFELQVNFASVLLWTNGQDWFIS